MPFTSSMGEGERLLATMNAYKLVHTVTQSQAARAAEAAVVEAESEVVKLSLILTAISLRQLCLCLKSSQRNKKTAAAKKRKIAKSFSCHLIE